MYNVKYIQKKLIKILADNTLDIYYKSTNLTSLHLAIISGDTQLVKKYCNSNTVNVYTKILAQSPLHLAIEFLDNNEKRLDIIKILVEAGADLQATDCYGETPIIKAVRFREDADIYFYLKNFQNLKNNLKK